MSPTVNLTHLIENTAHGDRAAPGKDGTVWDI